MNLQRWISNLPIRRKFGLLMMVQAVFLIILALFSLRGLYNAGQTEQRFVSRIPQMDVLAKLRFRATHYRGDAMALLTVAHRDPAFTAQRLEKLQGIEKEIDQSIAETQRLEWRPEDRALLEKALAALDSYRVTTRRSFKEAAGDRGGALMKEWFVRGKVEIDASRADLGGLLGAINARSALEKKEAEAHNTVERWIIGLCILFSLGLAAWITQRISRQVAGSV